MPAIPPRIEAAGWRRLEEETSTLQKLLPPDGNERLKVLSDAAMEYGQKAADAVMGVLDEPLRATQAAVAPVLEDVQAKLAPVTEKLDPVISPVVERIDAADGWPTVTLVVTLGFLLCCFCMCRCLCGAAEPAPQEKKKKKSARGLRAGVEKQLLLNTDIRRSDSTQCILDRSRGDGTEPGDYFASPPAAAPLTARGAAPACAPPLTARGAAPASAAPASPFLRNSGVLPPLSARSGGMTTARSDGKTPRASARGKMMGMHQEAAQPAMSARGSARGGFLSARVFTTTVYDENEIQSARNRCRYDPCHSAPQTEALSRQWNGFSADHRIQMAFSLESAEASRQGEEEDPDPTLPTSFRHRNFHYIPLPPPKPNLPYIDELFFVLHSTRVNVPEPLPDDMVKWVRNALQFGDYYGNSKLRTRDIYGLDDPGGIFDENDFVVLVPQELNPHLARTVKFVQKLFKPGSNRMPAKQQIIPLPVTPLPTPVPDESLVKFSDKDLKEPLKKQRDRSPSIMLPSSPQMSPQVSPKMSGNPGSLYE